MRTQQLGVARDDRTTHRTKACFSIAESSFRFFSGDLQIAPTRGAHHRVNQDSKEAEMHIQVVNFQLKGLSAEDYRAACDQLAPAFAEVPGLMSKVWLANSDTNTYGGVYTWRDREAMIAFAKSDLFASVKNHPNLTEIRSADFAILEAPTHVTKGLAGVTA
jgi:heme-degrading monooxygenase HmoA